MKRRDLERELRAAGARRVRIRGSHHLWKMPSGLVVGFSVKGTHSDLAFVDVARVKRALRREGP